MVIVQPSGGLGNQFYIYATGKYLAQKLNTDMKLDANGGYGYRRMTRANSRHTHNFYVLGDFNIQENFATPEEIKRVRENGLTLTDSNFLDFVDSEKLQGEVDILLRAMGREKYFINIIDTLRKEFTLKKPLSPKAEELKQKILSAECSVSMHFRYGDYAYNPKVTGRRPWFYVTPLNYCYTSVEVLKHLCNNPSPTVFVFSDNITWLKESLHLNLPTEFVEGCESASEELILMSLCQNNITPGSSFSKIAAMLNANPNKITIFPKFVSVEQAQQFTSSVKEDNYIITNNTWDGNDSGQCITIPCNFEHSEFKIQPFFSLLLVVNNDAATIADTLDSLFAQDYKYYEVIIIDNASTDGSRNICRQKIEGKKNVTFKRLHSKIKNAKAWNMALSIAQGKYVLFLKGNDRFLTNALTSIYLFNNFWYFDILHMFSYLNEDNKGNVDLYNKKYSQQRDEQFKQENKETIINENGIEAARLLINRKFNSFLGTKIYNREFLAENNIKFDKQLDDEAAELFFQMQAFFKAKFFMHFANAFYVAPKI